MQGNEGTNTTDEEKQILQYTLQFSGKQVSLPNGEPLGAEEAYVLREALSRYLESLETVLIKGNENNSPASVAYERFIQWCTPVLVVDENEGEDYYEPDAWLQYDNRKAVRRERIARAEKWDLQFASREIQERAKQSSAFLKELAESTLRRNTNSL